MRKLSLALAFVAALSLCLPWPPARAENTVGPTNQALCNKQAQFTGTGAIAQLVAGVAGQSIFICGWHITATTGTNTFQFTFGTGSTCTSPTNLTPLLNVNSAAPSADHITAAWIGSNSGQTLCINATVTNVVGMVF
jgi:hypothetical protein